MIERADEIAIIRKQYCIKWAIFIRNQWIERADKGADRIPLSVLEEIYLEPLFEPNLTYNAIFTTTAIFATVVSKRNSPSLNTIDIWWFWCYPLKKLDHLFLRIPSHLYLITSCIFHPHQEDCITKIESHQISLL